MGGKNGKGTLENGLAVPYTVNHTYHLNQKYHSWLFDTSEMKMYNQAQTCTQMFIGVLFIISKI